MAHDIQEQVCIPCSPDTFYVKLLMIEVCTLIPEFHWNAPLEEYVPLQAVVHHQFWFFFCCLCSLQSLKTVFSAMIENMLY